LFTTNTASDDLVGTLDNLTENVRDAMKKIPRVKNQVGGIFIKDNDIHGLDVYDVPFSWENIQEDVIRKEGSCFIDDSNDMFVFRPEKAVKLIQSKLRHVFEEKSIYDKEYRVIEIRHDDYVGEAVVFNQKVIHLTLWKNNK